MVGTSLSQVVRFSLLAIAVLALTVPSASAEEPKPAARSRSASEKEDSCWKARFAWCDGVVRSADLVFVYPRGLFKRNPNKVIARLQKGWNVLRSITGVDPVKFFGQRIVVGYRHPSEDRPPQTTIYNLLENGASHGFPGEHWPSINIPWDYATRSNEPEGCMTHEMVHPFIHVKPLRTNTQEWVEGACDFLRLVVYDAVGMPATADKNVRLYRSVAWKPGASYYHDHAGRLIRWCQQQGIDYRRPSQLRKFLPKLWETDLDATLGEPIKSIGSKDRS